MNKPAHYYVLGGNIKESHTITIFTAASTYNGICFTKQYNHTFSIQKTINMKRKSLMLYGIYVEYKLYRICNDYFVI